MTAKQRATLKTLHAKWVQGTATGAQIIRCMELEQKARAAAV